MKFESLDMSTVDALIPERSIYAHKGDFGKLLLLCGSRGFTGAAALAAMGTLRTGAGLVYLGVPECIYPIVATKLTEPVVFPLPDCEGMLSDRAVNVIERYLRRVNAVLLGPGLGQSCGTFSVVEYVLGNFDGPVILDADGINVLKLHKDILRSRTGTTILTPHEGEFERIGGKLQIGRAAAAMQFSKELGVITVLKGHQTVITDGERCYINLTGNPGMAVGGSGDVLAGMITSLIGQGLPCLEAAACGAWLHGSAGDICAKELGQYAMLPSDMLNVLPRLLK